MAISMDGYSPYRNMGATCSTRPVRERLIRWTKVESEPFHDGRFQVKTLRRSLVASAAELWRSGYPELYGSFHEFILDPGSYEDLVALDESWERDAAAKDCCMPVVVELETERVVSASMLTKVEKNLEVEFTFAATLPDYRMRDLTDELRRVTHVIAEGSGAEYFTTFCETWHPITQNWCLKGGWRVAGIYPGRFTRWNGEGEYRGCTVHFYKFAGEGEACATRPEEWHLAPGIKELWEVLERINRRLP
jgi:hypothetical protein